jgi:hypothetical protein
VTTGFAGTLNTSVISTNERKLSVTLMKEGKAELLQQVKGITTRQFNFKTSPTQASLKELVFHITAFENETWNLLESAMKAPSNPSKRRIIRLSDVEVMNLPCPGIYPIKNPPFQTAKEAIEVFRITRMEHIRYMKETTEDMRNHVIEMPFGWIDAYQLSLMMAAHSKRHSREISEKKEF